MQTHTHTNNPLNPLLMVKDEKLLRNLIRIADAYHNDADFRDRFESGEHAEMFKAFGVEPVEGVEYEVIQDTDDVMHIVMPVDPNLDLKDEQLEQIVGGSCASTLSTFGCSTIPASLASLSSACGPH